MNSLGFETILKIVEIDSLIPTRNKPPMKQKDISIRDTSSRLVSILKDTKFSGKEATMIEQLLVNIQV